METKYSDVISDLKRNISGDKREAKESSPSESGFCKDLGIGGISFEITSLGFFKIKNFLFADFEKSGSQVLFFWRVFEESYRTIEEALLEATWVSFSLFRDVWEPFRDFLSSVNGFAFCERLESELRSDIFLPNFLIQCSAELGIQIQWKDKKFSYHFQ